MGNDHAAVTAELEGLQRTSRNVHRAVWGVAIGVMIYGAGNVTGLLLDHGVHPAIAWMLSPMVDLGLVVALVGGKALDRYQVRAGWLAMLRWTAGLMTWSLNVAGPALRPDGVDGVGVLIHSCGPVLLLIVAEAAASVQRGIADAMAQLHREMEAAAAPPIAPAPPRLPDLVPASAVPAAKPRTAKPRTGKRASAGRARRTSTTTPADVDDLMPLGWQIAADLETQGLTLTRDRLLAAVRASGQSISSDRASALLARLKAEAPAEVIQQ
ncbi:hypothetical protein ACGFJC_12990 [Nonomuraea fuscirosea]|uniref:hypothetical protein n=1 Tax=Nonomuraea fuscirosea TaxID=1291556 RepID=UPI00347704ED